MNDLDDRLDRALRRLKINYTRRLLETFGVFGALFVIVQVFDFFDVSPLPLKTPRVLFTLIFVSLTWFCLTLVVQKTKAYRSIRQLALDLLAELKKVSERHAAITSQYASLSTENDSLREAMRSAERDRKMLEYVASQHLLILARLNLGEVLEREASEIRRLYGITETHEERERP